MALKSLEIDELIVIPNYLNPFKKSVVASPELRYNWLKRVTKSYNQVTISNFEINRGKPTPSIVTVEHFAKSYDKIYFIIGSDNLESLHLWKDFEKLNGMVEWVVATRKSYDCKGYKSIDVAVDISATSLRKHLDENYIPKEILQEVKEIYEH